MLSLLLVTVKAVAWLIPALIGGGLALSAASTIYATHHTNNTQRSIANNANAFNAAQNDLAWERQQEAWQRENEYNSPANQVRRLEEAGLSPYLAYSQMSSGNAGTLNVPSPISAQTYNFTSPVQGLAQFFGTLLPTIMSGLGSVEDYKQKAINTEIAKEVAPEAVMQARQQTTLGNWSLNTKEYESEMLRLRRDILKKYGLSDAEYNQQLIRSRIAAMTYDKQKSYQDLLRLQHENAYYSKYGYRGENDFMGQIIGANSTGGAILRALGGVGRATGIDSKLLSLVRQFIGF